MAADPLDNGLLDDNKVTYTARLAYDVTDNLNAYFTYATGWKAGAFNLSSDSRAPDPVTGFGRTAAPEEVELFEFGVQSHLSKADSSTSRCLTRPLKASSRTSLTARALTWRTPVNSQAAALRSTLPGRLGIR